MKTSPAFRGGFFLQKKLFISDFEWWLNDPPLPLPDIREGNPDAML